MHLLISALCVALAAAITMEFQPVLQWKELEFQFPSPDVRQRFLDEGLYVPGKAIPVDFHYDEIGGDGTGRVFLSMPRQFPGRPIPLGVVSNDKNVGPGGPIIKPFPNFEVFDHLGENCDDRITSVYRITSDSCNRMWVVDTGKIAFTYYCPAKILAYDLKTDKEVHRYEFPQSVLRPFTILISPVIDVQSKAHNCAHSFVYIADPSAYGIVVYDVYRRRSWRVEHRLFYPFPTYGLHTIADQTFELMLGILGMALYPSPSLGPAKRLYFHAMSSQIESYVDTAILKNYTLWANSTSAAPESFIMLKGVRPGSAIGQRFDSAGNLYFGLYDPISVVRWNMRTPYTAHNMELLAVDNEALQFSSSIKIYGDPGQEKLCVLTNKYQKSATDGYNSSVVNFRILAADIDYYEDRYPSIADYFS